MHGEVLPQMGRTIQPLNQWSFESLTAFFTSPSFLVLDGDRGNVQRAGLLLLLEGAGTGDAPDLARRGLVPDGQFGAAFGFTVMGRVALLIGRLNFLILDWIYPTLGI